MAADNTTLTGLFKDIADAIRSLRGTTSTYVAANFPEEILKISTNATATAADILLGKTAYSGGAIITGTMPNNGDVSKTLGSQGATYTIPKGYHNGSGVITANINNATITSGAGTITITGPTYNSTNANFTVATSVAIAAPTVGTAGYISSSVGTKNTNSASKSLTLSKIGITASLSNGGATTPVIARTTKPSTDTWVDAASGAAVTTKPTSNPYVRVDVAALTKTITATPSVSSEGYGTTTSGQYTATNATATAGHNAATAYIPITTTSASRSSNIISYGTGWITEGTIAVPAATITSGTATPTIGNPTYNSTNANFTISVSGTISAPTVSTEGYVSSSIGTKNTNTLSGTKTLNKVGVKATLTNGGATTPVIARTAKTSGDWTDAASGAVVTTAPTSGPYVQVDVAAFTKTLTATPAVSSEGYGTTSYYSATDATSTVGHNKATTAYVPIKVATVSSPSTTATLTGPTYNSTNANFTITASGTIAAPSIGSEGYVSSSVGTRNTGSISGSKTLSKVTVKSTLSNGGATTPVIARTAKPSADTWIDAASGASTTTKPTSGPYVQINVAASTKTITSTPSVSGEGYGTTSYYTSAGNETTTAGHNAATTAYVPITVGAVTTSTTTKTLNPTAPSFTYSGNVITASTSNSGSISVSPNVTSAGYITSSQATAASVPISGSSSNTYTISALTAAVVKTGTTILGVTGTFTSDATASASDIVKSKIAYVKGNKITGTLETIDLQTTANTFTQVNNFSAASTVTNSSTSGTITISTGGLVASSGIKGAKVYNAVWNDLTDLIPVDDECELEFGRCYCFDGSKYYKSRKYLDEGIIGIHSDTSGFEMGHKDGYKELKCSVAGFALAYVDQTYEVGTLLTCGENGTLTKISNEDKINYPEKIIASYWKDETEDYWGTKEEKVLVNGRKWVKVR